MTALDDLYKWLAAQDQRQVMSRDKSVLPHGLLAPGNIDLWDRPVVTNPDGSISTVRSASFNVDGSEVLVPTVAHDGSGLLSDRAALDQYYSSGKHLGVFDSPTAADSYAKRLHELQAEQYLPKRKRK
jgi:hypothetical protein